MFCPLPQRELSALEKEWEEKLRAAGEGPPEIRSLYQTDVASDGIAFVQMWNEEWESGNNVAATANALYWRLLADDVRSLPAAYPAVQRAFLEAYAECGFSTKARRKVGISHTTAWRYLKLFNESRKVKSDNV